MPSTNLQRTMGTATNAKKGTLSFWTKLAKSNNASEYMRFFHIGGTSNDFSFYYINDNLNWYVDSGATFSSNLDRELRDYNGYYHIVLNFDTTLATAGDRSKLYINGELQSQTITGTITQNADIFDSSHVYSIGATNSSNLSQAFAGILAHFHFIDGTAYDASAFGQTDSASGIWKPKTSPSVTYGTNGFFLDFANSSDLGNDVSGNNNDFTMSGSGTQTLDTPSNVFATMNPLINYASDPTYSLGNLKLVSGGGAWHGSAATLAVSQGKWYWEVKLTGTMTNHFIGVQSINGNASSANPMAITGTTLFYNNDGGDMIYDGSAQAPGNYGLFSSGDIMGLALDMDAGSYGQITIYKNGVALVSDFNLASTTSDTVYPFIAGLSSTQEINFGNGYFGTTAVASAENDSAGLGKFEYSVPTGYYALCTKNIADYG